MNKMKELLSIGMKNAVMTIKVLWSAEANEKLINKLIDNWRKYFKWYYCVMVDGVERINEKQ